MVKRVFPPIIPAASRVLHYPPRFDDPAPDQTNALTLTWEAAGAHLRLLARVAAPLDRVIDLGIYATTIRSRTAGMLRSCCREGRRPPYDWIRPWTYLARVIPLRPHLHSPGVLCFLQPDGWVNLLAERWPGRETTGQALGRYPLWEVLHWLNSPPVPSPPDEETNSVLPIPLEGEITAVVAWWTKQLHASNDQEIKRRRLTSPQIRRFAQAFAAELHAHLIYVGWDANQPDWRAEERALGTHDQPDPILTRTAFAAGLWDTLVPHWSKYPPKVRIWINPGQVQLVQETQPLQFLWPMPVATETMTVIPSGNY